MATLPVLGDLDLTRHEILNSKLQLLGADPGTPVEGLNYWHTGTKEFRIYNGTAWIGLGVGSVTGVTDTAEINLSVAAGLISGTLISNSIALDRLANIAANSFLGNNTGSPGTPLALTVAQAKALLAIQHADISNFAAGVQLNRLDQMAAPTAAVALNGQKITGLADGTAAGDAATFGQVSALAQGIKWKDPVDAATTANITLSGTQTVDTVVLAVGDRVLVKNQTAPAENGIYVVAAGAWTRTTDADAAAELNDATVLVEGPSSATNQGDIYNQTATVVTVGTTSQTWTKIGEGNTIYTADGTSIILTGTVFSLGTVLVGNLGAQSVTEAKLHTSVAGAGLAGGNGTPLSVDTGAGLAIVGDEVVLDTAIATRKYSQDYGNGVLTDVPITHNLGTKDVQVTIRRVSDDKVVLVPWTATSTTVVTVNHDVAPTAAQYRITVQA